LVKNKELEQVFLRARNRQAGPSVMGPSKVHRGTTLSVFHVLVSPPVDRTAVV
jgi:hypothetical protein